jgi:hypothetical protein
VEDHPEPRRSILLHRRQGMGVGLQRHLNPLVPEPVLYDVRGHALSSPT